MGLNRAFCEDSKARSLDGQDFLANKHALGAITDRVLEERLTAQGFEVAEVGDDGSLTVVPLDRPDSDAPGEATAVRLPAAYVEADLQLGYASTVHAAQGVTVDSAHLVTDGAMDSAALYVGMSRGRLRNTAHVATAPDADELPDGLNGSTERPSALAVLEGCLERDGDTRAATVEWERDLERLASMPTLAGRIEVVVRHATRERMERHLDQLVADGHLDADIRARLCADQAAEHLARVLRAVEQSGRDPRDALREAVTARGLHDAGSVAQVLSHRITGGRSLPAPRVDVATAPPADISAEATQHLDHLLRRVEARRSELGARVAHERPAWALDALGPVPHDGDARAEWERRAGIVAAHREATGWTDEHRAIGTLPGLSATERRSSYVAAWEALGRPEANLDEAAMTDGQLRVRVRAAEAEEAWAPPHADDALRAAETDAEAARHAAALASAAADAAARDGDAELAAKLRAEADRHRETEAVWAAAVQRLTLAADARARWAASTAVSPDTPPPCTPPRPLTVDGAMGSAALYVGTSRGRLRNTAHVATTPRRWPNQPGGSSGDADVAVRDGE